MSSPPRILVIHNPAAGRTRPGRLTRVLDYLTEGGARVTLRATAGRGDAEEIARAEGAGFDVIAVAGGDGTLDEVANGLGKDAPPLGLIPLGTANVFAAEIGLGGGARDIARTLLAGVPRAVFAGRANGRRFLVMAGAGLDAEVVAALPPALKRRFGKTAYVFETLRQAFRYAYPMLEAEADGRTWRAVTVVACKGRHYGGPYLFAPGADPARPDFELVLFEKGGAFRVMLYGLALVTGLLRFVPGVRHLSAREITIRGPEGAPVQGDGDVAARLPARVVIDPEPLRVLYPPRRA